MKYLSPMRASYAKRITPTHTIRYAHKNVPGRCLTVSGLVTTRIRDFVVKRTTPISQLANVERPVAWQPYWSDSTARTSTLLWTPMTEDLHRVQITSNLSKADQFLESLVLYTPDTQAQGRRFPTSHTCHVGDANQAKVSRSKDDAKKGVRKVTVSVPIFPTREQRAGLNSMEGGARYFYNKAKHFSECAGTEARQRAIAELESRWAPDLGCCAVRKAMICGKKRCAHGVVFGCMTLKEFNAGKHACWAQSNPHRQCGDAVDDPDADVGDTGRYLCQKHANALPNIRKTVVNPSPRLRSAEDGISDRCQKPGCSNLVKPRHLTEIGKFERYWCCEHAPSLPYRVPEARFVDTSQALRDAVVPRNSEIDPNGSDAWIRKVPYDVRAYAVKDFTRDLKSYRELRRNGHEWARRPGFRSKRNKTWSFAIPATAIKLVDRNHLTVFPAAFAGSMKDAWPSLSEPSPSLRMGARSARRLSRVLKTGKMCDANVVKDACGTIRVHIPIEVPFESVTSRLVKHQVVMDCGGRTFNSFYSASGVCGHIGHLFYEKHLNRQLLRADLCMSLANKTRGRKQRRLRRRAQALRTKVRNVVRDLHRKTCRFLCDNFDSIFVTKLSRSAVRKLGRRINNKAVRNLMSFANAEFIFKLKDYAAVRGVEVVHVSEGFTTKTCPECGRVRDMGSKSTRECECGFNGHRDLYSAKGIFLRTIS